MSRNDNMAFMHAQADSDSPRNRIANLERQLAEAQAENARLQAAIDNMDENGALAAERLGQGRDEIARLQTRVEEQKRITDSIIAVDVAGLRKAWRKAEALAERRKEELEKAPHSMTKADGSILPLPHDDDCYGCKARAAIEEESP